MSVGLVLFSFLSTFGVFGFGQWMAEPPRLPRLGLCPNVKKNKVLVLSAFVVWGCLVLSGRTQAKTLTIAPFATSRESVGVASLRASRRAGEYSMGSTCIDAAT